MEQIKGYSYGDSALDKSPITLQDLDLLKKTLLWSKDDERYLNMAGKVLQDQTDQVLDLWYNYVGSNEHLLYYFTVDGKPDERYLAAVRERFKQWVLDLCNRPYDQAWLDYQYEIAKRHHATKKNKTDKVDSVPIIHFRYIVAFIYPITATIKDFLAKKGDSPQDVEGMHNAWFKAVTLTALLWCYPYVQQGEF
ncbi:protoglobin [Pontibacter mucosus]|uniref:Protoglobin n=1 Tax=Pontibacter mucosus TaxID=1649266 RepID=A0A2T5YCU6_9BACT|nr:protoglobin domain-containing protein [Pontibacter mucosus]PTX14279.1 protoglobin [Pontibacter mucosus]